MVSGRRREIGSASIVCGEGEIVAGESEWAPPWFAELLAHRHWIHRERPFPHVYAAGVFAEFFAVRLAAEVAAAAGQGRDTTHADWTDGPTALFASREWARLLAGFTDAPGALGGVLGRAAEVPLSREHAVVAVFFADEAAELTLRLGAGGPARTVAAQPGSLALWRPNPRTDCTLTGDGGVVVTWLTGAQAPGTGGIA